MTIKVGDRLPEGTVQEFIEVEGNGCSDRPEHVQGGGPEKGKKIAIFGLPGAFTPTCSAKHVPSYLANIDKLKAKGVDEMVCFSVNDPFVMGAWARDQKAAARSASWATAAPSTRRSSASSSTSTRAAWACAASASRCWWTTAW